MPSRRPRIAGRVVSITLLALAAAARASAQSAPPPSGVIYHADCNDPDAHEINCTEPTRAIIDTARSNGYEYYIGHAEPSILFFSTSGASGNNMQWKFHLPNFEPTPTQDGSKTGYFELYSTMWLGLELCDPNSNPFGGCVASSDTNNPATAGAAFLELQFYPPGFNCPDATKWCVSLHINTLQNATTFQQNNCLEPTTAALVTTNGAPGGPVLLMTDGDTILVTISDTGSGLRTAVNDLTSSATGSMVASGANGYVHNKNQTDCATEPFDFHPMWQTAAPGQVVPWATLGPNVAVDHEIGHWELCGTSDCTTPPDGSDTDDVNCGVVNGVGGCTGADNDHDGTSYKADWPDGTLNHPASFIFGSPNDLGFGPMNAPTSSSSTYDQAYKSMTFETTETTVAPFYAFYSQAGTGASCVFNFGNDLPATTNDFGKASQYGTSINNPCFSAQDLTITKTHTDPFTQGDPSDTFTITVTNVGGAPTTGTVTVVDVLPGSLTAVSMTGTGWTCTTATTTCTNSSPLAAGASYPAITLTVSVDANAPPHVINSVTVSDADEGTNVGDNNTATDPVTIRQHTTTTVTPVTQDYHDTATLTATVTPAGVSGSVEFFVNGSSVGLGTYNSATGVATFSYLVTLAAGSYKLAATFTSSDPLFLGSSGTLPTGLTVTLEEDTLSYTGDTVIANGGTATLSGVLLEDGVTPIAGRTVQFTLGTGGSAQSCSGVTNASGIATCAISPVAQPLGPGVVADQFSSDGFYQPASASATTIMFAFLTTGADVIGDANAAIGSGVTFWGAQWSSLNGLSGGPAPDSFKGFASATGEPPACGAVWSTRTGNSSNPPATLPSFMGVVVSTQVAQSGSTISGDVLSIVVVQTNGGYAPNPGHPGTGTVLATYCHR